MTHHVGMTTKMFVVGWINKKKFNFRSMD